MLLSLHVDATARNSSSLLFTLHHKKKKKPKGWSSWALTCCMFFWVVTQRLNDKTPSPMQSVKAVPEPICFAPQKPIYTSVVTFALAFVTLTPNCLARAMMSIRFREETALAIL